MILYLPIKPKAYKRARAKGSQFYVPKDYQDWKVEAGMLMRNAMKRDGYEPMTTPLGIDINLEQDSLQVELFDHGRNRRGRLRGDLDNYIKAVLDAGNGVLYEDDRQVEWINGGFV